MNKRDLYDSIGNLDEEILERSEKNLKHSRFSFKWRAAAAAVLTVCLVSGLVIQYVKRSSIPLIAEAAYPQLEPYPNEEDFVDKKTGDIDFDAYEEAYDKWRDSLEKLKLDENCAQGLQTFFMKVSQQYLGKAGDENLSISPVNLYMALAMLTELTDGESRQQLLDLLGAENVEEVRKQAQVVWRSNYRNEGATACVMANSVWLNKELSFHKEVMECLAENYYASSYRGEMGSKKLNQAFREWINKQTDELLKDQTDQLTLDADTILALASTINFRAKWTDQFFDENTKPQTFHAPGGDQTCDFMHSSGSDNYYWGDHFGAVGKSLDNMGGTMWFFLPDEGVKPETLFADPQVMKLLQDPYSYENCKTLTVNLAMPKFDTTSKIDLRGGLKELGVTDIFDGSKSDFSPMTSDVENVVVSQAEHAVRVAVDEEGVVAAAYTVIATCGLGMPPEEKIDFTLDRPFAYMILSENGTPLFSGVVNQPN